MGTLAEQRKKEKLVKTTNEFINMEDTYLLLPAFFERYNLHNIDEKALTAKVIKMRNNAVTIQLNKVVRDGHGKLNSVFSIMRTEFAKFLKNKKEKGTK